MKRGSNKMSSALDNDCKTERGQGRWFATGDGRKTIKDRSNEDSDDE